MATMKAWQFRSSAGPIEKSTSLDSGIPKPTPTKNEVLIEVYSTALNPIDYKVLELGLITKLIFRSPVTPGLDICGRTVEIGSHVDAFRVGDVVYGLCDGVFGHEALSQYVPVMQDKLVLVPEGSRTDEIVFLATVGITTYHSLKSNVKKGDKVFINGGSEEQCHVITSCSTTNVELCKSLGADEVLDYKAANIIEQLKGQGQMFDLVLDNVGSPTNLYRVSHHFLKPSGRFLQIGLGISLSALKQFLGNKILPGYLGGGKRKYELVVPTPNSAVLQQIGE
ncbi:reticulon-4-interacting protein mitochondrial precursor [Colletotrichum incanum]|uniref:Reticulon-4-interacting protein mitochondrial n=1 Tax=Colletotrichum incanum TaxID=1573173 RepID=A0A162NJV3_COLIC|nr:reticulon-4-interacting protein mitochondrial precursor [Colletotrichum incanum]OHW95737.1 reticulon-4-interacting protein mitochondrial precursor [Colletotrichum incanum]